MIAHLKNAGEILVYRAASAVEAHALVAHLADQGIEARVLGEPLQGAYAGIHLGGMELPEVWIADKDRDAAEPLIAAWRTEHSLAGAVVKPGRFQFPMWLMLLVMTYVALILGSTAMSEQALEIFAPLLGLALFATLAAIAWVQARRRKSYGERD
jgi:hypothetical protein